jgi:hypothetical protein
MWCKAGIGTPHTRCREMHHSERERTKDSNLFLAVFFFCKNLVISDLGSDDQIHRVAYILLGKMRRPSERSMRLLL